MRPPYLKPGEGINVAELRKLVAETLGMGHISQSRFARMMGVSYRAVQEWEQGRRKPSGPARTLLLVIGRHPEVVKDVIDRDFWTSVRLGLGLEA